MTAKDTITLPGEEGEWESIPCGFLGEPGGTARLEIHDWPGRENVRVLVRKKAAPEMPEVMLYDSVNVTGEDNQGNYVRSYGAVVINIERDKGWMTVVNTIGLQHVMPIESIETLFRNGKKLYHHSNRS
ncbi:MAG: hypothetical protein E6R03_04070 [Hyphomicrobiaceae bacterium]|nr:MAG: hypothetical protein E6R03_04070 [Hyphomicrobiaceae bacterium]